VQGGTSGEARWGTAGDDCRALGASFIMGIRDWITQPEAIGVILARPVDPVNADVVTRVIDLG
jgi:hypothetical protein